MERTLNGKPVTREQLGRLQVTNPTLEAILSAVRQRSGRGAAFPDHSSGAGPRGVL